jgi:hypothetical protein
MPEETRVTSHLSSKDVASAKNHSQLKIKEAQFDTAPLLPNPCRFQSFQNGMVNFMKPESMVTASDEE